MSIKKILPLALGAAVAAQASANTFEGSLSNEAVKADVSIDRGSYFLDAGGMYHTDDGKYGYIGAHIEDKDTAKDYPLQIGIGARLLAVDTEVGDNDDGVAVGLGGFYRYTFPKANRFSVYGSLYYSPQVLSFQNIENMYQAEIRGEYRTLRNALVFVRYGLTNVDLDDYSSDAEMNKSIGIGVVTYF
ncbi:YfaZ family outer membrane protein [Rhodanobacter aciditrophus]|uniref:YfaZ family outer membrane protein n=1 Tax=Rhodanobacter aciditrophus TaxID=1623218 RepID=A0ABW4B2G2_9GAMM